MIDIDFMNYNKHQKLDLKTLINVQLVTLQLTVGSFHTNTTHFPVPVSFAGSQQSEIMTV